MDISEKIKKALECRIRLTERLCDGLCSKCQFSVPELSYNEIYNVVLNYIQQLELMAKPNEQVRWERDVAIDQLRQFGVGFGEKVEAQVPKWISVDERLPEVSDVVLVIANGKPREHITLHNAYLIASFWGEEGWIADGFEGWDKLDVSYWMELPEGPKEG